MNKIKCRRITHKLIRIGFLKKENCFKCGNKKNIHAHHPNYQKPKLIIWLCRGCHVDLHRIMRDEMRISLAFEPGLLKKANKKYLIQKS